ncbi:hypothetical protein BCF46_0945 [Litoreibacter meonggei]|uniref:General secretion pathway protein L n=1 Tax=Litoreibacter meonggei TaxID=1049199 RepID=A0A497X673_9RHOB|nr:PilN domain-containing protein [Litoreibacter meonggei]RLJ60740.1 hypothetical protein BCF46_0945 [Litoreibacter meonggei]
MALGQQSTLMQFVRAEVSLAIPEWAKAMFLGQPTACHLVFKKNAKSVTSRKRVLEVPASLLERSVEGLDAQGTKTVDIYLPQASLLRRDLKLPATSLSKVDKIIALDTLQKTPFKPSDIYFSISVGKATNGTIDVVQWIARRDGIARLRDRLRVLGLQARRVHVEGAGAAPLVDFSAEITPHARAWKMINLALLLTGLGLLSLLYIRPAWDSSQALHKQETQIARLTEEAVALRSSVEKLRGSASERDELVDYIINRKTALNRLREITVLLPDNTWISDLRIQKEQVALRGTTSGSAAQLLLDILETNQFASALLTGPISQTPDGRERFDMMLGTSEYIQ